MSKAKFKDSTILKRKSKLVALLLLSYRCIVTIFVLLLFLMVPWVGLLYMIVVFPDHTHCFVAEWPGFNMLLAQIPTAGFL